MQADSLWRMGLASEVHAHVHICCCFSDDNVTGHGYKWLICAELVTVLYTKVDINGMQCLHSNADGRYYIAVTIAKYMF